MVSTCKCRNCSVNIEFESQRAGETVTCPACELETQLFIPRTYKPPGKAKRDIIRWVAALGIALGVVGIGFAYASFLVKNAHAIADSTDEALNVGTTLVLMIIATAIVIMWTLFPIFVFLFLRRIEAALRKIAENTKR